MFKKNTIWIKIKSNDYYKVLIKLNEIEINIYDNKKLNNYILIKVNTNDYKKIKKYLKSYKISFFANSGFLKINEIVKSQKIFIICVFISVFLILFANKLVIKINIKSNNNKIREIIMTELKNNNMGVMKLKKNHNEVEKIVQNIINNNKDVLEWIEIKYDGLIMIVNVTEKTINNPNAQKKNCNIVASKDAKIISLTLKSGVLVKEINDYVYQNDVIISGNIIHNDTIKNVVCADGVVYGEVWYKIHIEEPLIQFKKEFTGKNRYNMNIKYKGETYDIFKSRITGYKDKEEKKIYSLNSFAINIVKEKEYIINEYKMPKEEAYNKAINDALDKIKLTLNKNDEILLQKVLKKSENDSTIILDIFVVTKEDIGRTIELEEEIINE